MTWNEFIKSENVKYAILIISSILLAFIASFIIRKIITIFNKRYSDKLNVDSTNLSFLKNSVSFILYSVAAIFIFYNIPALRSLGTGLFAGAGIAAVVIGFAAQKAFSNIISGIFILIFKPFSVGDTIEIGEKRKGIVEEITLRHIMIRDYEYRRILIPNSIISDETIINSSIIDEKIRQFVEFGISYDSDIDKAVKIIREEAEKHPNYIDNRSKAQKKNKVPSVTIRLIGLTDFSVQLKAYVWVKNNDTGFILKCDMLKSVKERFDKESIEIPFPYRTIVYKKHQQKK